MIRLSYRSAGVNIAAIDRVKRAMRKTVARGDRRVLNRLGAFASLVEGTFPRIRHPLLVLKIEEPGSKQQLASRFKTLPRVGIDTIHHLINDIVVMGALPLAVLDVIVCGKIEPKLVSNLVASMARACRAQSCTLVGGETSVQPGVVPAGTYVMAASIVGVVEKSKVIDGSKIRTGDVVLAVASNGLHTNGYSLVRKLLNGKSGLLKRRVGNQSFKQALMKPHLCYYQALRGLFSDPGLHGMAHITGGGIQGNLNRILPRGLNAEIDVSKVRILPVFKVIEEEGNVSDADMLRTFNMGVGLTLVVAKSAIARIQAHLRKHKLDCYPIGRIVRGRQRVRLFGKLHWR